MVGGTMLRSTKSVCVIECTLLIKRLSFQSRNRLERCLFSKRWRRTKLGSTKSLCAIKYTLLINRLSFFPIQKSIGKKPFFKEMAAHKVRFHKKFVRHRMHFVLINLFSFQSRNRLERSPFQRDGCCHGIYVSGNIVNQALS
jgi:hypothetical protein